MIYDLRSADTGGRFGTEDPTGDAGPAQVKERRRSGIAVNPRQGRRNATSYLSPCLRSDRLCCVRPARWATHRNGPGQPDCPSESLKCRTATVAVCY